MTDLSHLSEAVIIWTGWGETSSPDRDDERVVRHFGPLVAAELIPRIVDLEQDFYQSDARHTVADLKEMGDTAARQSRARHPELSEDAVQALAWCYTFDYR
jgi:hypothetical protein